MSDKVTDPITDQKVFENLYKQRRARLLSSITGMVRDRDRAEDITEAAFQTAWEKRAQFRGESSLGTWLHAIGLNVARRSGRHDRMIHRDPLDRLETPRYAEPDRLSSRLEQDERRALVWKALDRVPAKCRRLLIDRYIRGRSVQEIARRHRVPEGTVLSRIFTAKRLLRQAWHTPTPLVGGHMREENVRQIAEEALKRLADELQAGRSDALKNYLAAMGRFHHYSWNNVMLIQAQRPAATRVAGYHSWHDLGRYVRKGEKGIMIYAPIRTKASDREKTEQRPERPPTQESPRSVTGFRTAYVFDVEQTDGRPLPAFAATAGDPREYGEKLKAFVARQGIALEYDPSIAPAQGDSSGGRIRLVPGLSAAEEFSVLAHELTHEMLHHRNDEARLPKTVRETQAEAVAFVVCRGVGLDTNTAASDYIALYNGDKQTLAESLSAIHATSTKILNELLPEERLPPTAERISEARAPHESPERTSAPGSPHSEPRAPAERGPDPLDSVSWDR